MVWALFFCALLLNCFGNRTVALVFVAGDQELGAGSEPLARVSTEDLLELLREVGK